MNMRKLLMLFGILLASLTVRAQTTAVSATITDSDGLTWNNGSFTVTFVPAPGAPGPVVYNGAQMTNAQKGPYTGSMNGSGAMSVSLPDNTFITPSGSQWKFVLCPNSSGGCSSITMPISGTTLNLTSVFSSGVTAPRFPALGVGSYGYADVEVSVIPPPGGTYFNVASLCNRQWTGSSWVCSTSVANPVSGFGTTNFITKYTTGASGVIGNSSCSDNGTTFNCADNMTQAGVQVETGTGATNTMSKFTNGPGGVQGNSQCTDNGTTVSCSGSISAGTAVTTPLVNNVPEAAQQPGSDPCGQIQNAIAARTTGGLATANLTAAQLTNPSVGAMFSAVVGTNTAGHLRFGGGIVKSNVQ